MQTIIGQLHEAFERSGLSVGALLKLTGLKIDRSSMSRKIRGELRLNTDEAEAIAAALNKTIVWPPRARRAP